MPESIHPENISDLSTPDGSTDGRNMVPADMPLPADVPLPARRAALSLCVAACGAALLWLDRPARAALAHPDVQILRFLEEIEELQSDFFMRSTVSSDGAGLTSRDREILATIARQDREHVGWFELARGKYGVAKHHGFYTPTASQSRPPRSFNFAAPLFAERSRILNLAASLKETAVGAYHGLALKAEDPGLAQSIAALAGVEGRHAAALHVAFNTAHRPAVSEQALTTSQVMSRLRQYGFQGEALQ